MEFRTKEIVELLQKGYTRYAKQDKGFGSIQEKYGLKGTEVVELFSHPSLKHRKTVFPKTGIKIIDDLNSEAVETPRSITSEPEPTSREVESTASTNLTVSTDQLFS